jgi:serpin B
MTTLRLSSRVVGAVVALGVGLATGCGSSTTPAGPEPAKPSSSQSAGTTSAAPAASGTESPPPSSEPAPKATATPEKMAAAAKGDTEFALSLYARVKGEGNTLLSPASARLALAMAYAGAKGNTAEQMAKVLVIPNDPKVHEAFGAILGQWRSWAEAKIPSSPDNPAQPTTLRVANRLFGQKGRAFLPGFLSLLSDDYGAPLEQLDFRAAPDPSRVHINQWVEDRTEKRIKDLLPPGSIKVDTKLVIVNALYFKADWQSPFSKDQTKDEDFFPASGAAIKVPTMHERNHSAKYAETADAQLLELGYRGGPVAMTIVLPKAKDGLAKLENSLTPASVNDMLGKLAPADVKISLPKIKIESTLDLGKELPGMGMPDAFDATKADFSGIDGTREMLINGVVQKTFCAVDEKGTEAAAATAIMIGTAAAPAQPPKEFTADHPFLFLIRDTQTGSLLFVGRVARPG